MKAQSHAKMKEAMRAEVSSKEKTDAGRRKMQNTSVYSCSFAMEKLADLREEEVLAESADASTGRRFFR